MKKYQVFNFIDRLMRITDNITQDGIPLTYIYIDEYRELKRIVAYYFSVCKEVA